MSLVVPSLRGIVASAPWAKNELWRKAQAAPTLDLRFADSKSLTDAVSGQNLITFTRASSGTYVGSDGLIKTALADAPRFDHNPVTGESLGLLVEESRANSIRNNTMVGAVAGTPGTAPTNWVVPTSAAGVSREIIGTGIENGINYIDIKISGTTTGSLFFVIRTEGTQVISAANGQTWTASAYIKLMGGSFANANLKHGINGNDSSGAGIAFPGNSIVVPTGASLISQRAVNTGVFNTANIAFIQQYLQVEAATGVAIDITLRIGLPQLEQGAFATSPILTSGTAVTRSADVASITGTNFSSWYRQDEGTMFGEARTPFTVTGFPVIASGRVSSTDVVQIGFVTETLSVGIVKAGNVDQAVNYNAGLSGVRNRRVAFGMATNSFSISTNGGALTNDTSGSMPTNIASLFIGSVGGAYGSLNGTIRRLVYWGQRLPNTTLQAITQ